MDSYGAQQLPLAVSSNPVGRDDFLYYCLSYFQTIGNAYAGAEWQNIAPVIGQTPKPIGSVWDHDPRVVAFSENTLPAIFLFRDQVLDRIQQAQDIRIESGILRMYWVPPRAQQETRRIRAQYAQKLFKVLDWYLERLRDPAWIVPGDTDPIAAAQGSALWVWAKFRRLRLSRMRPINLSIGMDDGSPNRIYEAYESELPYEEKVIRDPSVYEANEGAAAVNVTIQTPDGLTLITEDLT